MKIRRIIQLAVLILAFASVVNAGNKCGVKPEECERQIRSMLAGKKYLGFQIVAGQNGVGIFVKSVAEEGPAEKAGLKKGDRILTLAGHDLAKARLADVRKLRERWLAADSENPEAEKVVLTINRYGSFKRVTIQVERMTDDQIDKVVATHLQAAHGETSQH